MLTLQQAGVVNAVGSPVEHGQRVVSYDTSLSGGVGCRRKRRNVYDKKP